MTTKMKKKMKKKLVNSILLANSDDWIRFIYKAHLFSQMIEICTHRRAGCSMCDSLRVRLLMHQQQLRERFKVSPKVADETVNVFVYLWLLWLAVLWLWKSLPRRWYLVVSDVTVDASLASPLTFPSCAMLTTLSPNLPKLEPSHLWGNLNSQLLITPKNNIPRQPP